jgi:hypothetical protein
MPIGGGGSGGSQPFTVVRFPFAWNTPGLVAPGVVVYTPAIGDLIVESYLSVPAATPFDGNSPSLWFYSQDNLDPLNAGFVGGPFLTTNVTLEQGQTESALENITASGAPIRFLTTIPLVASLRNDGDGTNPSCTTGAGELILNILKAA